MTDTRMRIIFGLVAVMAISFLLIAFAKAQQSTIRDANGRISTTVTTDSNGTKTFRDGTGRTTGTATIDANGMNVPQCQRADHRHSFDATAMSPSKPDRLLAIIPAIPAPAPYLTKR